MFSWTQPFGFPACDSFMEPVYPDLAGHLGVSSEEQGRDSWRAPRPSGVRVLFNPPFPAWCILDHTQESQMEIRPSMTLGCN
jgi:hypothetical protein